MLKALYNTFRGTLPDCLFKLKLQPRNSQSYQRIVGYTGMYIGTSLLRQDSDKQTGMVDDFENFFKGKSQCS